MPVPTPNTDEKEQDFVSRCMADETMNKEFPDNEQRAAICYRQWQEGKEKPPAEAEALVEVQAAGAGRPHVKGTAYSGGKLKLRNWKYPVVVDFTGLTVPSTVPLIASHQTGVSDRMGDVAARIEQQTLLFDGDVTGDSAEVREVLAHATAGARWQVSIGAEVHEVELVRTGRMVNGQHQEGPFYHVRRATLRELSVVAVGADMNPSLSVAASFIPSGGEPEMDEFNKWLEAKGWAGTQLTEVQMGQLKALYEQESAQNGTLDQIVAARRLEETREKDITRIAAEQISDRPGQLDQIEKMARLAIEARWAPERFELELMRATKPSIRAARVPHEEAPAKNAVVAAICMTGGMSELELKAQFTPQDLEAAHKEWPHGIGLQELFIRAARQRGFVGYSVSDLKAVIQAAFAPDIRAAGWSTYSLPGILGDSANKFLLRGFDSVENAWRQVAAIASVKDFKTTSSYALTGGFEYELVPPGGELKHATAGEEAYTNKADTYGKMFAVTRTDIINDDLGALTKVPQRLGRGAALKLNKVFWTEFLADHTTFFAGGNSNVSTGGTSALSIAAGVAAIAAAEILFKNQTDPDGNPLGATPKILLVPTALDYIARTLMSSAETGRDDEGVTGNVYRGAFRVVTSAYLSNSAMGGGYSSAYWYLLADPVDLPMIEVAFLNGKQTPTVESADADFNSLGVQFRGYHDFGVNKQEYRAAVRSNGS